uniref:Uncharacterized protein n=1 Tax=Steinernema glaseri TaxID=37863 RepID=A0A1I7Z004_9BILA
MIGSKINLGPLVQLGVKAQLGVRFQPPAEFEAIWISDKTERKSVQRYRGECPKKDGGHPLSNEPNYPNCLRATKEQKKMKFQTQRFPPAKVGNRSTL